MGRAGGKASLVKRDQDSGARIFVKASPNVRDEHNKVEPPSARHRHRVVEAVSHVASAVGWRDVAMEIACEPFAATARWDWNRKRRERRCHARVVLQESLTHAATTRSDADPKWNKEREKKAEKSYADRLTQPDPTLILEPHEIKREKSICSQSFLLKTTSATRRS